MLILQAALHIQNSIAGIRKHLDAGKITGPLTINGISAGAAALKDFYGKDIGINFSGLMFGLELEFFLTY